MNTKITSNAFPRSRKIKLSINFSKYFISAYMKMHLVLLTHGFTGENRLDHLIKVDQGQLTVKGSLNRKLPQLEVTI